MPDRRLAWNACHNARDVGGYATADGGVVRWGALIRADDLCRLTDAGKAALRAYGVRTVVDLRRGYGPAGGGDASRGRSASRSGEGATPCATRRIRDEAPGRRR